MQKDGWVRRRVHTCMHAYVYVWVREKFMCVYVLVCVYVFVFVFVYVLCLSVCVGVYTRVNKFDPPCDTYTSGKESTRKATRASFTRG